MKAAVFVPRERGKVVEIVEAERPAPGANEVLVRVRAASVNPLDWRLKSKRPGVDVAGVVEAVGAGVTGFKAGDGVFGTARWGFAEFACAPAGKVAGIPEGVTFEEAAAVPIAGLTALQGLRDVGRVKSGEKVLVIGAAGGVGTFAVQVARMMGARVTGVCSSRNVEQTRGLGAERVVDYGMADFAAEAERYDVVLDNVGSTPLGAIRRVMAPGGRCVMVGAPKTVGAVLGRLAGMLGRRWVLRQRFVFMVAKARTADLALLGGWMKEGKLKAVIDRRYPFAETAAAIAYVEGGHARGKVVIGFGG